MRRRRDIPPGQVRIIGGRLRGSRLAVPSLAGLRPTPQRLRQTLFDWLAPVMEGARVLDAFAGSGALGIEALSRGAREAVFFERDRTRAGAIAGDLERLQQPGGSVRCVDALQALDAPADGVFHIVFVDPPFDAHAWGPALQLLDRHGWLAPDALVYVESAPDSSWAAPVHWRVHRQRAAGAVLGTLLQVGQSTEL